MKKHLKSLVVGCAGAVGAVLFGAVNSMAVMTSLIDFGVLATDITPLMTTAVTAAAGLGALILAARLCWGFFKKFSRG